VASSPTKVVLTVAALGGTHAYRVCVAGAVTRASDNFSLATATATFGGFNLLSNGSFEANTGAPTDWTMVSSGTLSASTGAVAAEEGVNVASFTALTTSISGREALSICFAVQPGTLSFTGFVRTPQPVDHTKASFKIYWFTDSCTTPATHASDTQSSFSLSAPDAWQSNTYSQPVPAGATHAYVSIRATFVSGIGANTDIVYFDDIAAQQ
jgi:hypothetical protein